MRDWYENTPTAAPRTVIPAKAGIQCLVSSRTKNKTKTLDPRLLMSRMTEGERRHFHPLGCRRHACMRDWYENSPTAAPPELSFLRKQESSVFLFTNEE